MTPLKGHKPVLIIIAGPNGSGKTSVTSKILNHEWLEDSIYINPDIVAQEKFGDWNSPDAIKKSVKYFLSYFIPKIENTLFCKEV